MLDWSWTDISDDEVSDGADDDGPEALPVPPAGSNGEQLSGFWGVREHYLGDHWVHSGKLDTLWAESIPIHSVSRHVLSVSKWM